MKKREKSQKIYDSSLSLMPGGVNSPVRAFKGLPFHPLIAESGKGALLYDADGHEYIDYCGSFGALILGHVPEAVCQAASEQLKKGTSFGIATAIEMKLAEKVLSHVPSLEKIRFVSSGTEAAMSAIRVARGFTGKQIVLKFNGNYHGHSDGLLIQAGSGVSQFIAKASSKGIPEDIIKHTVSLPFNDVKAVSTFIRNCEDLACVIVEPIAGNMGVVPGTQEFLSMLREETLKKKALLIFDEVITGFRVGLKGAQHLYGITPDLTVLGKVIGGGFPAAAFGGKREMMDLLAPLGEVYQAGTLSGSPLAMAAGLKTLEIVEQPGFYEELSRKSEILLGPIRELIEKKNANICLKSHGSMFSLFFGVREVTSKEDLNSFDIPTFNHFFETLFEQGIYIPPSPYEASFISSAHTEKQLLKTREIILEFIK